MDSLKYMYYIFCSLKKIVAYFSQKVYDIYVAVAHYANW